MQYLLVSHYRSGNAIRSRSVGANVLSGKVEVPAPPARLVADWQRDISLRLAVEPGDVEALPLARARMRWRGYRECVQAVSDWLRTLGLNDLLAASEVALMACRGARYHHDGAQYGSAAFCNLFLSEDCGLDLHFASTGLRIPLVRGTVAVFDTGQAHGVVERGRKAFKAADFPAGRACTQVFLTWELPIENAQVARQLGVDFDIDPAAALLLDEEQVWLNGARADVCPESGRWRAAGQEDCTPERGTD